MLTWLSSFEYQMTWAAPAYTDSVATETQSAIPSNSIQSLHKPIREIDDPTINRRLQQFQGQTI